MDYEGKGIVCFVYLSNRGLNNFAPCCTIHYNIP
jgi:hypothetical protein